ncbi:type II toxin-antitoxin system RelE/ParE family toxin [Testudinibacter sp. TR-2022]|uniref:type II toxin-antitoxin system RelE family toxin n=1 Tax=Testudinibacter sp. TR-2022 TaxID=2585029 RepID=UPI00111BA321|nr:type II toxin-antitoxin system RelE/ParE family toxin [Testudinibacter sp. TR-2022]TNH05443.1 type II toxin-antitoxin system RelE/ParE family toxin [Pasteurellaceae bacterium Phil31]TNH09496.1 type II toxin-antitoxin system RelE/ParE family toxin [Testudinibacter sp. TR-2022]TNH12325.1 type II toxin-antitoxin system RelE/ParE family toxin [Testudinibacter sp. TR-2022]TNH13341.1 type II toxin-antitoxin system RelE/ParE family toxin [Testudinibacter sp. TR-2022]TNH16342.1 type II toxin-antito
MSYELIFDKRALKEWRKLGETVRMQFKKKLTERLIAPHTMSDKLSGYSARYKIKLRTSGYRLVYEVNNNTITVLVLAIGKCEGAEVYKTADKP